jgi:hypothetical protein
MTRVRTILLPSGDRLPLATLRRLEREQRTVRVDQPALFELRLDARPLGSRTAAERYEAPNLFTLLE